MIPPPKDHAFPETVIRVPFNVLPAVATELTLPIRARHANLQNFILRRYARNADNLCERSNFGGEGPAIISTADEHFVVDGHHRLAVQLAHGRRAMPVRHFDLTNPAHWLTMQRAAHLYRVSFEPSEQARVEVMERYGTVLVTHLPRTAVKMIEDGFRQSQEFRAAIVETLRTEVAVPAQSTSLSLAL